MAIAMRFVALEATALLGLSLAGASAQQQTETPAFTTDAAQQQAQAPVAKADVVTALSDWDPEVAVRDGLSVEKMLDEMTVYGPTGKDIGNVKNIVVAADGSALALIVEVYGFVDIGDTHLSVPWSDLTFNEAGDGVTIPVTEGQALDYSNLEANPLITAEQASTQIQEVEGEGAGRGETGAGAWRATDLLNDFARLQDTDGDGATAYGYVDDVIINRSGEVSAVVVSPDIRFARAGDYIYPYYRHGWLPGSFFYDLPYTLNDVKVMKPVEVENNP